MACFPQQKKRYKVQGATAKGALFRIFVTYGNRCAVTEIQFE